MSRKRQNPFKINITESQEVKELKPGETFTHLEIVAKIGEGGMGSVYLAQDKETERNVALKLIHGKKVDFSHKQRFFKEIKALAKLQHPNIVQLFSFGYDPTEHYTFEYVEGETLETLVDCNDWIYVANIFEIIFRATHSIHKQGIIHRDLKPSNIMLDKNDQPKIMDFGLAKTADSNYTTNTGCVVGSLAYMSPEQVQGHNLDPTTDIYSLGATFYQILTARPPFQGENILPQILYQDPIEPRKLKTSRPVELEAICLKCLEKNNKYRYKNAAEVAQDFHNFVSHLPIKAKPPSTATSIRKFFMRNKAICSLALFAATLFMTTLLWYTYSLRKEQQKTLHAKHQEEKAKLTAEKQAQVAQLRSTKIALFLAHSAAQNKQWQKCGALACKGLEFIHFLKSKEAQKLKQKCRKSLYFALHNFRRLWVKNLQKIDILAHKNYIQHFCFSPDKKIIACIAKDGALSLWKTATGEKIASRQIYAKNLTLRENRPPIFFNDANTLSYISPQGELVNFSISQQKITKTKLKVRLPLQNIVIDNHKVALLEFETKNLLVYDAQKKTYQSIPSKLQNVKFDLQNNTLAVASFTRSDIEVWDTQTAKMLCNFTAEDSTEQIITSKNLVVTKGTKGKIKIWDIKTKRHLYDLNKNFSQVKALSFLEDELVIVADYIYVWNIKNNKLNFEISRREYTKPVLAGNYLVCANKMRHNIELWDIASDKKVSLTQHPLRNFLVMPNDHLLIFNHHGKSIFDTNNLKELHKIGNQTESVFIPENMVAMDFLTVKYVAVDYCDGKTLVFSHDLSSQKSKQLHSFELTQTMTHFPRLASRGSLLSFIKNDWLHLYDIHSTNKVPLTKARNIKQIFISPTGHYLATVKDTAIHLWNCHTKQKRLTINNVTREKYSSHHFSADGSIYVYTTNHHQVHIWNTTTKRNITSFTPAYEITSISIHPQNKLIALSSKQKIEIWDIQKQQVVYQILHNPNFDLQKIAFNDKGSKLFFHTKKPQPLTGYYHFAAKNLTKNNEFNPLKIFDKSPNWIDQNAAKISRHIFHRFVDEKLEVKRIEMR